MELEIDELKPEDWEAASAIYLEGINTKIATFQNVLPSWNQWDASHCKACRLVARSGGHVLGWAALSRVSDRCVYAGVADLSIYIGTHNRHTGVGTALLKEMVRRSEAEGFWTLQSESSGKTLQVVRCTSSADFVKSGFWRSSGKWIMESGMML